MPIVPLPVDTPKSPPSTPTSALLELAENPVSPSQMPADAANTTVAFKEVDAHTPTSAPQFLRSPSEEAVNSNDLNTDSEETRDANSSPRQRLWMSCMLVVLAGCTLL